MKRYLKLREEMWNAFDLLVKKGAKFPELIDVYYPIGTNPEGLMLTTDGRSKFLAKELVANPKYQMHIGEDMIVGTGLVTFIDVRGNHRELEPDITDTYWLAELLDGAV